MAPASPRARAMQRPAPRVAPATSATRPASGLFDDGGLGMSRARHCNRARAPAEYTLTLDARSSQSILGRLLVHRVDDEHRCGPLRLLHPDAELLAYRVEQRQRARRVDGRGAGPRSRVAARIRRVRPRPLYLLDGAELQ